MRLVKAMLVAAAAVPAVAQANVIELDFDRAYGGTANERATIGGETVTGAPGSAIDSDRGLFFDEFGVRISIQRVNGETLPGVLYNTSGPGANSADPDLLSGAAYGTPELGRVLIVQEAQNNNSQNQQDFLTADESATAPFGFARPDDDLTTATLTFWFDPTRYADGIDIGDVKLVDLDEAGVSAVDFRLTPADGSPATSFDGDSNLVDSVLNTTGTATACSGGVCEGDNSLRTFSFDPAGDIGRNLRSFSITFNNISGGIEALAFTPSTPISSVPLPAPAFLLISAIAGLGLLRTRRPA